MRRMKGCTRTSVGSARPFPSDPSEELAQPSRREPTRGGRLIRLRVVEIQALQAHMDSLYRERDGGRGTDATFRWLIEEIGELARAVRKGDQDNLAHEFGDVLAWLASLANLQGVDLEDAVARYANGCPRCGLTPCDCPL